MEFIFKTGNESAFGKTLTSVECIRCETNSLHPRTNRRKLRKFAVDVLGIKPHYVKMFLKDYMGLWTPERLGVACPLERMQIREEEAKWLRSESNV